MARIRRPTVIRREPAESRPEGTAGGHQESIRESQLPIDRSADRDDSSAPNNSNGAGNSDYSDQHYPRSVDPAEIGGASSGSGFGDGGGKRRRGRKPGTRNKPKPEARTKAQDSLARIIAFTHSTLAKMTGIEELEIDEEREAKPLAECVMDVASYYNVPAFSGEAVAWFNLSMCAVNIYGPRMMAYNLRRKTHSVIQTPAKPIATQYHPPKEPISIREAIVENRQDGGLAM